MRPIPGVRIQGVWGSGVLLQAAEPVAEGEFGGQGLSDLVEDMYAAMNAKRGIGLAAPQVGVSKRVFVWHVTATEFGVVINPEIAPAGNPRAITALEGCLSVPGGEFVVWRSERVLLTGFDFFGEPLRVEADGLLARVFQHELDHLNGVLITDLSRRV